VTSNATSGVQRLLDYSRSRVEAVLAELAHLKHSDFPHSHASHALNGIAELFDDHRLILRRLGVDNDPDVVKQHCAETLRHIHDYLPLLGFIVRSTNVRNSFEVFQPLLRLAWLLLGEETKLVLSSEWQFSPLLYDEIPALPGFALIGLPASESSNPLLVPLAGHELGHSVWVQRDLGDRFSATLEKHVKEHLLQDAVGKEGIAQPEHGGGDDEADLFLLPTLSRSHALAVRQTQETFCDLMGVQLFVEAYLHAFAYIMAPGMAEPRIEHYPKRGRRVRDIVAFATQIGVEVPDGYADWFLDDVDPPDAGAEATRILQAADSGAAAIVNEVTAAVRDLANEKAVPVRDATRVDTIRDQFRLVVPASSAGTLCDILNAAWEAYHDPDLWRNLKNVRKAKSTVLSELVLKSIEVLEYEALTEPTHAYQKRPPGRSTGKRKSKQ
jgi:hypothetical protein